MISLGLIPENMIFASLKDVCKNRVKFYNNCLIASHKTTRLLKKCERGNCPMIKRMIEKEEHP